MSDRWRTDLNVSEIKTERKKRSPSPPGSGPSVITVRLSGPFGAQNTRLYIEAELWD